jgi:aldehyde:ferredoxin oxidoreductase
LDTIWARVTIAFAMELYEKGILSKEETDGGGYRVEIHP